MIFLSGGDDADKQWLERAARKGSAEAARRLAGHYRWVGKDNHNAYFWYESAAGYGDRCAKRELGDIYNSGLLGRIENRSSAAHWYRLAADELDVEASFKLGRMYEKGIGVLQDYEQAILLYKYAAHMGHVGAMYWIGRMHEDGKVHKRDVVRAHTYFNLAASLKDLVILESEGFGGLGFWDLGVKDEDIIAARKQVERLMSRDQILDAQQLAKDWYPVIRDSHKVYVKRGCN